jgi:integrase
MRLFDRVRRRPSGGPAAMRARLEGAMSRRRLRGWNPPLENINALVASGCPRLLARSRELVVTNGYAANACEAFAANLVGDGIKPSSLIEDATLRDRVQRLSKSDSNSHVANRVDHCLIGWPVVTPPLPAMPFRTDFEKRDKALFAFLMLTGVRVRAVASLKIKHVNVEMRHVF